MVNRAPERGEGKIARLFFHKGFGFIGLPDRDLYFHARNVTAPKFDDLRAGDLVRFVISADERGLQAVDVQRVIR